MPGRGGTGPMGYGSTTGGCGQGTGRGLRRHDGSGRGASLGPATRADGRGCGTTTVAVASAPGAGAPDSAPAVSSRARTVAIVARPESCIACGTCVEACPRGALAVEEIAMIEASLCTGCGACVDDCSSGALALLEV